MHNLLRFIKINQVVLLFILIEGISIILLLRNNSYQANKAMNFSTQYTGLIYDYKNSLSDYLGLKKMNDYLITENAKLHSLIRKNEYLSDSNLVKNKKFNYIAAKVINKSVHKRNNFITINKGSQDGIKPGMGVVTDIGVIGVVHSVSKDYALILSLLHTKSSIGIFLKTNMHIGNLKWEGFNYRLATIKDFPIHIPINIGDTIITNSYSNIYPEGVNIGSIINLNTKRNNGFYNTSVKLFQDFNNLRYVYVVYSNESKEQRLLEGKIDE